MLPMSKLDVCLLLETMELGMLYRKLTALTGLNSELTVIRLTALTILTFKFLKGRVTMDYHISKSLVDDMRRQIKTHEPYQDDDPEWNLYDAIGDPQREKSTSAKKILEALGIDPYDDNDYGDLTE